MSAISIVLYVHALGSVTGAWTAYERLLPVFIINTTFLHLSFAKVKKFLEIVLFLK